jgi:hypothetical protein
VRALSRADERAWREQESITVPRLEITQTCVVGDVVQVAGLTEPGADLRVDGRQVRVDRRGRFAATSDLAAVRDRGGIDVVATDRYGVKAEVHQDLDRSTGEPCPPR